MPFPIRLLAAALASLLLALTSSAAHAMFIIVNDIGDAGDANPGDGICATAANICTLRAAVEEANALPGSDGIQFNVGTATIELSSPLVLTESTNINGGEKITLDGQHATRHFTLSGANYGLFGLALANGSASDGGSIHVTSSTLTINHVDFTNNRATGVGAGFGGAVYATHTTVSAQRVRASGNQASHGGVFYMGGADKLALEEFVAEGNSAVFSGGAVSYTGTNLLIGHSLFHNNITTDPAGQGGGIDVVPLTTSALTIESTTFESNASAIGGALAVRSVAGGVITHATFANNNGGANGAIVVWGAGTQVTLKNTLVGASFGGPNCRAQAPAALADGGHNLQFGSGSADSCGASIPQANPLLAGLADNGGFSRTMALQPGSPAIDAIDAASGCIGGQWDQRGVSRPVGTGCDIGAFEADAPVGPGSGGAQGVAAIPRLDAQALVLLSGALAAGAGAALRRRKRRAA
ncbi:MAG: choice-of-anchor Q domain-containing protein [Burkholderiaceae bacterium]